MWCGGAVAAAGGYLLAKFIETALLSKIFAVFLVTFGLYQLIFTGKNSQMNKTYSGSIKDQKGEKLQNENSNWYNRHFRCTAFKSRDRTAL